jgi:hypothetical protein
MIFGRERAAVVWSHDITDVYCATKVLSGTHTTTRETLLPQ